MPTLAYRQLVITATLVLTVLAVTAPAYLVTAAPGSIERENEPIVHRGSTACGVERLAVETRPAWMATLAR
jgi:hypothetical protein